MTVVDNKLKFGTGKVFGTTKKEHKQQINVQI